MTDLPKLILPPTMTQAGSTTSGLLVPVGGQRSEEPPALDFVSLFITWKQLTEIELSEAEICERLETLSAFDCLGVLGRLSCMVHSDSLTSREKQIRIIDRLGWPEEMRARLVERIDDPKGTRILFFPQQLVHLTRLAVLHADPRPADDFDDGQLIGRFVECLLGVSDVFAEPGLDESDPSTTIPWILRQLAINGSHDSPLLWSRYYDMLIRSWDSAATGEAIDAAATFKDLTGISMPQWLMIGLAIHGRFLTFGKSESEDYFTEPAGFFASTDIDEGSWTAFIGRNSQTLDECRESLKQEEACYGATQYRAQAFETRPLLRWPDKRITPLALDSLERRCTEGMFFELADGAEEQGGTRDAFTKPFGAVFEDFVQRAWERMLPSVGVKRVHRAKSYKRGSQTVESTDAVLDGGPAGVIFCEVVSRRPMVATLTRGDWQSFLKDLELGPLTKARQLHLNIADYRSGALRFGDLAYTEGQKIWPMLVMTEGFPTMPPISQYISEQIAQQGWLHGLPPLAILGSEDLGHLEGLLESGFSAIELLEGWKQNPVLANLPFANYLSTVADPRISRARQAPFYSDTWEELTEMITTGLFPRENER